MIVSNILSHPKWMWQFQKQSEQSESLNFRKGYIVPETQLCKPGHGSNRGVNKGFLSRTVDNLHRQKEQSKMCIP